MQWSGYRNSIELMDPKITPRLLSKCNLQNKDKILFDETQFQQDNTYYSRKRKYSHLTIIIIIIILKTLSLVTIVIYEFIEPLV